MEHNKKNVLLSIKSESHRIIHNTARVHFYQKFPFGGTEYPENYSHHQKFNFSVQEIELKIHFLEEKIIPLSEVLFDTFVICKEPHPIGSSIGWDDPTVDIEEADYINSFSLVYENKSKPPTFSNKEKYIITEKCKILSDIIKIRTGKIQVN